MAKPVRVVIISHACVLPANQVLFAAAAAYGGLEFTLIAPSRWQSSLHGSFAFIPLPACADWAIALPVFNAGDLHLHTYRGLGAVLTRLQPELVLLDEDPYSLVAWQVLRLQRSLGFRFIIAFRQNLLRYYPPPFCWIEQAVLRAAQGAIATSPECLDVAHTKGYKGEAAIVYYPVDTDYFRPPDQSLEPRPFTVGYAGRMVRAKGLTCLLAACQQVQLEHELHLLMVGEGPDLSRLRTLANQWLRPGSVTWKTSIAHEAMRACYHDMDLLVLPSLTTRRWKEQFGRVLGEAMACGVPVVGSSSGFIPEFIRATGGGMVFPEGDILALARMLSALAREPLHRQQLAAAGRAGVLAHYSVPVLARRWHELLLRTSKLSGPGNVYKDVGE